MLAGRTVLIGFAIVLASFRAPGADQPTTLVIENSVLLSWPARSNETNVVVVATSIDGPWVPLLEPSFRRLDEICAVVPTRETRQFFALKPGFQVFDDASGVPAPWDYESDPGDGHVGMTLTLELFDIQGASIPVASMTLTNAMVRSGVAMPPGFHGGGMNGDVTLDNLRFVGVRPD